MRAASSEATSATSVRPRPVRLRRRARHIGRLARRAGALRADVRDGDLGAHWLDLAEHVTGARVSSSCSPTSGPSSRAGSSRTTQRCCCASTTAQPVLRPSVRSRPAGRTSSCSSSKGARAVSRGTRRSRMPSTGGTPRRRRRSSSRIRPQTPGRRRRSRAGRPGTQKATAMRSGTSFGAAYGAMTGAEHGPFPTLADGDRGMRLLAAAVAARRGRGRWTQVG
jgi:predicted dehydrogenase